jgi:hypothetical protein
MNSPRPEPDEHKDPLTGEPDSHPASTGAGAITGGLIGAATGSVIGGPLGAVVGIGIGAVAGGLGGKALGHAIDETEEEDYWRQEHCRQPFGREADYEKYQAAYRVGYKGAKAYQNAACYEEVEADLEKEYGGHSAGLPWDKAQHATRAAWHRARSRMRE